MAEPVPARTHLVVVIHGMWGSPSHVRFLADRIAEAHRHCLVLVTTSNAGINTYAGIEVCAVRVMEEVMACVDATPSLRRISVVGYSAGGLFGRYAIGIMERVGLLDRLEPMTYLSIATPHYGVRFSTRTALGRAGNAVVGRASWFFGGRTTQQLTLADSAERPLLLQLASHDSCFVRGLLRFRRLLVAANARADNTVGYASPALALRNPYRLGTPRAPSDTGSGRAGFVVAEEDVAARSPFVRAVPAQRPEHRRGAGALAEAAVTAPATSAGDEALSVHAVRLDALHGGPASSGDSREGPVSQAVGAEQGTGGTVRFRRLVEPGASSSSSSDEEASRLAASPRNSAAHVRPPPTPLPEHVEPYSRPRLLLSRAVTVLGVCARLTFQIVTLPLLLPVLATARAAAALRERAGRARTRELVRSFERRARMRIRSWGDGDEAEATGGGDGGANADAGEAEALAVSESRNAAGGGDDDAAPPRRALRAPLLELREERKVLGADPDPALRILRLLHALPFRRIDCYLPGLHTHGMIVVRSPVINGRGREVIRYLISRMELE